MVWSSYISFCYGSNGIYRECSVTCHKQFVVQDCDKALTKLHTKNFCHGEFRENNILMKSENSTVEVKVIDFDWCGTESSGTS